MAAPDEFMGRPLAALADGGVAGKGFGAIGAVQKKAFNQLAGACLHPAVMKTEFFRCAGVAQRF